jgi:chromosome segregation ATPase
MEQLSTFQKAMIAAGLMPAPAECPVDPKLDKPINTMYDDNKLGGNKFMNLEDRVSALERRQLNSDARIEGLYRDMATGIKQLSEDMTTGIKQLSEDMATGAKQFTLYLGRIEDQIEDRFDKIETDITSMKERLDKMDARFDRVDERLNKMDARFDRIDERLGKMDERFDKIETDIAGIKSTMAKNQQETVQVLTQILERLP